MSNAATTTTTASDAEATFAALPPPTQAQSRDMGWSRDWSRVWADHEKKLAKTYNSNDTNGGGVDAKQAAEMWKSREDLVVEGGGRVMFFDLTGGPTVRLAKERAMVRYSLSHSFSLTLSLSL